MSFAELGLGAPILKAIEDAGYTQPTPIQQQAIPKVLQGRDILGCAQTGTGKTASFTLPMIDILAKGRARARMPRSLILEPTRELAAQVSENFEVYGKYNKLNMALLIGGVSFGDQDKKLDRGVDVLIATPGRLLDHFERGKLLLRGVEVLVIDEADRMLDMGFIPDVERIVSLTNPKRQTLFLSATMPPEIRRLADMFLTDPEEITVAPPASPAKTVEQTLTIVHPDDKREALRRLLRDQPVKNALIFCNRKRDVDIVDKSLRRHGFDAAALHGDMSQSHRTETLQRFKDGALPLLVCSDVAARGLDIAGMSHVFLFDLPMHAEDYVHRIGRTGRAGMKGRAFALGTPEDGKFLGNIEKLIGAAIPRFEIDGVDSMEIDDTFAKRRGGRRSAGSDSRRGGGGGDRQGGRNRRSERPAKAGGGEERPRPSAQPAASPDPQPQPQPQPQPDVAATPEAVSARDNQRNSERNPERNPKRNPQRNSERKADAPAQPQARRNPPSEKPARGGRRKDGDRQSDKPVVGLGDHVPAFLLRPSRRT